jgi:hypothetical protein
MTEELELDQVLGSLLTLSGTATNTYSTSCANYLETYWPETGSLILDSLAGAYADSVHSAHFLPRRTWPFHSQVIFKTLQRQPDGCHPMCVTVIGPRGIGYSSCAATCLACVDISNSLAGSSF